jgi:hypothetical protein
MRLFDDDTNVKRLPLEIKDKKWRLLNKNDEKKCRIKNGIALKPFICNSFLSVRLFFIC